MWNIYRNWYNNQSEETKAIVKRFFEKHTDCYFSASTGKIRKI